VGAVHVSRIGFTPLKGGRHLEQAYVDLVLDGPVGDRVFCLVDRARERVLRTVENPALLRTSASWRGGVLTTTLPAGTVTGVPQLTDEVVKVDYWGRVAALEVVGGPWAAAYSRHLGREVVLARSTRPGEVVYGSSVSLVTSSALAELSRRAGTAVDASVFRATFTVDDDGSGALDGGDRPARLRIGDAEVEPRSAVPRCAVVDLDPMTGERRSDLLRTLAGYRRDLGGVVFGLDAVVTRPGRVHVGAGLHGVERG
jgi:uncharacterized protein